MDSAADYAYCDALLRRDDKDRWLACLFLPAALRPHVVALYAFSHEIASVRLRAHEPLLGEIRFQYWRDVLTGERGADEVPVAAALLDTVERFGLPRDKLISLIDARLFDLYDAPMPSVAALEAYAKATTGSLFHLAATILAPEAATGGAAAHAGVAYALTGLLRGLPWQVAAGQTYVPRELYGADDLRADRPALDAALAKLRALARHPADLAEAGGAIKVASQPQAKILARFGLDSGLDHPVHFLVAQEIIERRGAAGIDDVAGGKHAVICESAKNGKPVVQGIRKRHGVGMDVVLKTRVYQFVVG
ncbi:MAG: phytoene/squalene synthase family protein, partial [Methylovirgula sp.]